MTIAEAVYRASREADAAGLCFLPPAEDGSKRPLPNAAGTWEEYKKRRPTKQEQRRWYPGRTGIGVIAGKVSGYVESWDFDDAPTYAAFLEAAEAAGLFSVIERIEDGCKDRTPSGGVRWLVRYPADVTRQSNQKLARRLKRPEERKHENDTVRALIELPDHSIVAPTNGSVHPTGKPYVRESGGFGTIASYTAAEREALIQLARSFDEMPKAEPRPAREPRPATDDLRPGDDFNARATWAAVLEPHGWTACSSRDDVTRWRRPGKTTPGISATTNIHGSDLLYVFSSSTPFDAERGYSKFSAYAVLNCDGDFSKAAADLAAQGYGEPARAPGGTATADMPQDIPDDSPRRQTGPAPYHFAPAVPEDHFVTRWIAYADSRTDAAHELHELAALVLLAAATPTVRARLSAYPNGLGTNLYGLFVADSTTSRKSTAKDIARDVLARTLPDCLCSDAFSPEGFVEQLASRPRQTTLLFVDEFGELLSKLHHAPHMAGMRGLLLTIYGGDSYRYVKHSKRTKEGGRVLNEDDIVDPHLSILGATTPAVFNLLTETDVISGLLPRFAIIMPTGKPARRPFFELAPVVDVMRNTAIVQLAKLHEWATGGPRPVRFEPGVLQTLDDDFFVRVELIGADQSEVGRAMLARLPAMALKLCLLMAAGRPDTVSRADLAVTREDADAAMMIARRWQGYALAFAARIGESDFERKLQRALTVVRQQRRMPRHVVARLAHVDKKTLDAIRDTLIDRGQIVVAPIKSDMGRPGELWAAETGEGRDA